MKEEITITTRDIEKEKIGHSKWLKHKESRFNALFPKTVSYTHLTLPTILLV